MRRQENQVNRPTAGGLPVPLFNQKKRNRVPLTSAPSYNDFFSHREYMDHPSVAPGPAMGAPHSHSQGVLQPSKFQQYGNRPAPGAAATTRAYAPLPHPYKGGNTSSKMEHPADPVRQQDSSSSLNSRVNKYQGPCSSASGQSNRTQQTGFSHMGQQSSYKPPNPTYQYSPQPVPQPLVTQMPIRPSAPAVKQQAKSWNFTNSFGPQTSMVEGKKSMKQFQPVQHKSAKAQSTLQMKPAAETSLRILTAVIDGMRHWSQFKDKVPFLFEIYATLDSAVTVGPHGAKNFLVRNGKEVVQCVYYENEQELPRLIRGQVHRCVGNYDRLRKVLMCVSIRPGLPSELRNAQEAVKVCDAEMRALVNSLSEI